MKNVKNTTAEKPLPNSLQADHDHRTTAVAKVPAPASVWKRNDETMKLNRRYSFDDNGGGYLGL